LLHKVAVFVEKTRVLLIHSDSRNRWRKSDTLEACRNCRKIAKCSLVLSVSVNAPGVLETVTAIPEPRWRAADPQGETASPAVTLRGWPADLSERFLTLTGRRWMMLARLARPNEREPGVTALSPGSPLFTSTALCCPQHALLRNCRNCPSRCRHLLCRSVAGRTGRELRWGLTPSFLSCSIGHSSNGSAAGASSPAESLFRKVGVFREKTRILRFLCESGGGSRTSLSIACFDWYKRNPILQPSDPGPNTCRKNNNRHRAAATRPAPDNDAEPSSLPLAFICGPGPTRSAPGDSWPTGHSAHLRPGICFVPLPPPTAPTREHAGG
jgi:hypothetical protein